MGLDILAALIVCVLALAVVFLEVFNSSKAFGVLIGSLALGLTGALCYLSATMASAH